MSPAASGGSMFSNARDGASGRLLVSVWGLPKTRKSSFGLSGREPIRAINFDFGLEELLDQPSFRDKEINWTGKRLLLPPTYDIDRFTQVANEAEKALREALEAGPGTVLIDTGTEWWQVIQDVELEPVRRRRIATAIRKNEDPDAIKLFPFDYGNANRRMRGIMKMPFAYRDVDVVWTWRARPVYNASGEPIPGYFDPQWFGEAPSWSQVVVNTWRRDDPRAPGEQEFYGKITHNRWVNSMVGQDIQNLDMEVLRGICFDE